MCDLDHDPWPTFDSGFSLADNCDSELVGKEFGRYTCSVTQIKSLDWIVSGFQKYKKSSDIYYWL